MRARVASVVVALAVAGGCSPEAALRDEPGRTGGGHLAPSFPPLRAPTASPEERPATPAPSQRAAAPGRTSAPQPTTPAAGRSDRRAAVADPRGDLTPSADEPPRYADLTDATLRSSGDAFELRVTAASAFPATGPDDRTMNVASFYDVDGDGGIDFEVWANLADTGWGPAYFDDRTGRGRFGDESGVEVAVDEGTLVVRFPASHLDGAQTLRWAIASEWGRYEVISTPAAARDAAPDDGVAAFPSPS